MRKYLVGAFWLAMTPALAADPNIDFITGTCPYPQAALDAKLGGYSVISFNGTTQGTVADAKAMGPGSVLDTAAVACVSGWHFDPASPYGRQFLGPQMLRLFWQLQPTPAGVTVDPPRSCSRDFFRAFGGRHMNVKVKLRFVITTDGSVRDAAIDSSSGDDHFDAVALSCVQHWRYRPAIENGTVVEKPFTTDLAFQE